MTPQEKAQELFQKMKGFRVKHSHSKKCAIIAVDAIIENSSFLGNKMFHDLGTDSYESRCLNKDISDWWQEVKSELEKL